ncbi:hypothetical protein ACFL27_08210 [candidate division CSSED10-310 bacterium]|uniref:Outer membrane protein beta-barrel domain-containing protein n=1 Tax=candidate division CSSED10-310 bacterium TaxID=2855610 RepID=A0ABV6YVF3_UNCC1
MNYKVLVVLLLVLVVSLGWQEDVYAQETQSSAMAGRLGIGSNVTMNGGMGFSARYWATDLIAAEGVFNFTSMDMGDSDTTIFTLAGRGIYSLFDYGPSRGCVGAGISFGTTEVEFGNSKTDENFFGLEFFFLVENMVNEYFSVSGQTGLSYINGDDSSVLSVGTPSVIGLFGFHFYL